MPEKEIFYPTLPSLSYSNKENDNDLHTKHSFSSGGPQSSKIWLKYLDVAIGPAGQGHQLGTQQVEQLISFQSLVRSFHNGTISLSRSC